MKCPFVAKGLPLLQTHTAKTPIFFKNNLFTCDHKVQERARATPVTPRPPAPSCASKCPWSTPSSSCPLARSHPTGCRVWCLMVWEVQEFSSSSVTTERELAVPRVGFPKLLWMRSSQANYAAQLLQPRLLFKRRFLNSSD